MKKLSIAIPTYNRVKSLKKQINYFIDEGTFEDENIEFVISDNASNDGTNDYLQEIIQIYPQIKVNINESNQGMMANFLKVIEMADSEYIWIVSDDDEIKKGAVGKVIGILKTNNLSWLFLKFDCRVKNDEMIHYSLSTNDYHEQGIDLFKDIAQSNYHLGALMFLTASIHRLSNAREMVSIYISSNEFKNNNMAFPLGLSYLSAISGSAYILKDIYLIDNIVTVDWSDKIVQVFCRDQIAILDCVSREKHIKLVDNIKLVKSLENPFPEWEFFFKLGIKNNYAMKFYFREMPLHIIFDLIVFCLEKLRRRIKK